MVLLHSKIVSLYGVLVEVAPSFTNNPPGDPRLELSVGSAHRLRCKAEGNPKPRVEWYRDDRLVPADATGEFTLRLSKLQPSDSGHYTCVASNNLGSVNFTYIVSISGELGGEGCVEKSVPTHRDG